MMGLQENILKQADFLFFRYGVRRITMDDISRELSISKKTIYQFFQNKSDLVNMVADQRFQNERAVLEEISETARDPIDEMLKTGEHLKFMFQNIHPGLLFDIKKDYPDAWQKHQDFMNQFVKEKIRGNIQKGIEKGLYRKDLHVGFIVDYRVAQIQLGFDTMAFPPEQYNPQEVQVEMINHFIHGICTLNGHILINHYKEISDE